MSTGVSPKLLVVGWDAADWAVMSPLIEAGRMPHLKGLIDRGVGGPLVVFEPYDATVSWNTLLTGSRSFVHRILSAYEPDTRDIGQIRNTQSSTRRRQAIWKILSSAGRPSISIGFPASCPAEQVLGVSVSREFIREVVCPPPRDTRLVFPEDLTDRLSEMLVRPDQLDPDAYLSFIPKARGIDQARDSRLVPLSLSLAETATTHSVATFCMQDQAWAALVVHFPGIAQLQRSFMEYCAPRSAHVVAADVEMYGGVVDQAYQFHDMMLGRLLEIAGPDTNVMVVSAHGYVSGSGRPNHAPQNAEDLEEWHRRTGVLVMAGPAVKHEEFLDGATILDVLPTALSLLGVPAGRDMEGRVLSEALIEGHRTVATVDTWELAAGTSVRQPPAPEGQPENSETENVIAHLLELGYKRPSVDRWEKGIQSVVDRNRYNLARALLEAQRPTEAVAILEDLSRRHPDRLVYAKALFDAYAGNGQTQAMDDLVEGLWNKGYRGPLVQLGKGVVALARRQPAVALEHFDQVIKSGMYSPLLEVYVGRACLRLREWERAKAAFTRAVAADDRSEHGWAGLARACLGLGEVQPAAEFAMAAAAIRPDLADAHYHLGLALVRMEEPLRAEMALQRCIAVAPQFLPSYRKLAELYLGPLKDPAKARAMTLHANRIMMSQRTRRQLLAPLRAPAGMNETS